jgi:hypothetical protein
MYVHTRLQRLQGSNTDVLTRSGHVLVYM